MALILISLFSLLKDKPVTEQECEDALGVDTARAVKEYCLKIYSHCSKYAASKGIIIADTKFEFGLSSDGQLYLADEVLTPGN